MEPTVLQIGKQAVFLQKVQYPLHDFHVTLILILNVDEDVIQVYDDKDIELFCQDLIDITLEAGRSIR